MHQNENNVFLSAVYDNKKTTKYNKDLKQIEAQDSIQGLVSSCGRMFKNQFK